MSRLVGIVACAACYAPHAPAHSPCPTGVCPDGLSCSAITQTCEPFGDDAARPDGLRSDAMIDGAMVTIDAPKMIDAGPSVPMLIDQAASSAIMADQISISLTGPKVGDVLVLVGGASHLAITSVAGGAASWTRAAQSLQNSNIEIWYATADGTKTVTVTATNNISDIFALVTEWSGLATSGTLDRAHAANGFPPTADPGAITTTARDLLILGVSAYPPNMYGSPAPGSWTALTAIDQIYITQHAWYVVGAAGNYDPTVTMQVSWDAAIAGFHAAP